MSVDVRRLHLTLDDQAAHRYYEVPFELRGASSVEVRIDFDDTRGVVDLGCLGAHGWRGWSGGARRRFAITATAATPGYVPGELEDGRWAVVLGLHALPADGLDVEVTIRTPASAPPDTEPGPEPVAVDGPPRGSARGLPAPDGLTWYAGDMHAHSVHSDGSQSIDWLAARAAASGLDFLAVTDHNTVSHHPRLPAIGARHGVGLIPGQEVTTARGHANAFGDIGWIDFREPASAWVREVAGRGGLLSVNHAIDADCAWLHPLEDHPVLLEVWHTSWFRDLAQTGILGFWQAWGPAIPIGGSDFHRPDRSGRDVIGAPTTWVAATDPSPEAILAAVGAGRTSLSAGPDAPVLLRVGDELLALGAEGTVLVDASGRRTPIHADRASLAVDRDGPGGAGLGPYYLQSPDRRVVAVTA